MKQSSQVVSGEVERSLIYVGIVLRVVCDTSQECVCAAVL